jgi:Aminotransferase class I and II
MSVARLDHIPGFNIDRVAAAAGDDPDVLRLENLDTDIPPPAEAMEATRAAIGEDEANSWLPFTGRHDLKDAVAVHIERRGGPRYDGRREIVITSGEGDAMLDALFCLTDPGDEVILTDPTYAGMLNRVRLVGARHRGSSRSTSPRVSGGWSSTRCQRPSPSARASSSSTTPRSRPAGWRATRSGRRLPGSAASVSCGSSTGPGTRASSSTAGRSGTLPRSPGCAIERSPSALQPWSSG